MSANAASTSTSSSSSSPWVGAAPVSEGDFAFANGDFFALASGGNRHRRATREELSAHFHAGSEKDHPAHWFEAQLAHYGLKTSKTKSVARMRLFDAVQGGGLSVPAHVAALEDKLKKEWTRRDRLAKKTGSHSGDASTLPATKAKKGSGPSGVPNPSTKAAGAGSSKRKADVIVNVTVNAVTTVAAKKAKSGDDTKKTTLETTPKTTTPRTKQTARRGTSASSRGQRGGSSRNDSSTRASNARISPAPVVSPKRINTARRSRVLVSRGRIPAPKREPDSLPPPYSTEACDSNDNDDYDDDDDDDDDIKSEDDDESLAPLGLLNGQYDIRSPDVDDQWPQYHSDFDLILTLSGTSLWGRFNLGVVEGVLFFETRPYASSHVALPFRWRGREDQGPISYDDSSNGGWIKFMGGGRIQGWIDFQGGLSFRGRRAPGQGTRSEVSARELQDEWDGYSEREYERERVSRWY